MTDTVENSFEIAISGKPDAYIVAGRGPGVVTKAVPFEWPSPDLEDVDEAMLRLETDFELSLEFIKKVGSALYSSLFPEDIDDAYQRMIGQGDPFRVRLIVHPAELAHLPWEFLYDEGRGATGWLGLQHKHPLVRSVPNTDIADPIAAEGLLRVLFVAANPAGSAALDLDEDYRRLREGLLPLIENGMVKLLQPEMHLTPGKLRDRLRADQPHILHYSGHATFDVEAGVGTLVIEDDQGKEHRLPGDKLAVMLNDRSVRVVLLSACRTAEINEKQPFVGVAQQLANSANLPAVIAMQFPIGDENAIAFNAEFYRSLADRYPVDQAVTEGRLAVWQRTDSADTSRALVDWATPVLFMLGQSGSLWEEEVSDKKDTDDEDRGEVVSGDKIVVGNISGGEGIAIGRGAQASVTRTTGVDPAVIEQMFDQMFSQMNTLTGVKKQDLEDAMAEIEELKQEVAKGDEADESFLKRRFRNLARMAPEILDVVTAALINPALGLGVVIRRVSEKAREEAGLDSV